MCIDEETLKDSLMNYDSLKHTIDNEPDNDLQLLNDNINDYSPNDYIQINTKNSINYNKSNHHNKPNGNHI